MMKVDLDFRSFFFAWLVIVGNTMIGYGTFEYAFSRPTNDFNKVAFGGQIIRLIISLVAILILMMSKLVVSSQFVMALVGFYVLYTAIEISSYQKKTNLEKSKE
jgi:hypothetical protein